jgi:hypothetical protein
MLRRVPVRISFGAPMMPLIRPEGDRAAERGYAQGVMEAIAALREEQRRTPWK